MKICRASKGTEEQATSSSHNQGRKRIEGQEDSKQVMNKKKE